MADQTTSWAGRPLGNGALALDVTDSGAARVTGPSGEAYDVSPTRVGQFLAAHPDTCFVGTDVAADHRRLLSALDPDDATARALVWELARQSRWIDIHALDRAVRFAHQRTHLADRRLDRMTQDPKGSDARAKSPPGSGRVGPADLLSAHLVLAELMKGLRDEASTRLRPEYSDPKRYSLDDREELFHQLNEHVGSTGAALSSFRGQREPVSASVLGEPTSLTYRHAPGVEVRARIALSASECGSLSADADATRLLHRKCLERFKEASAELLKATDAKRCFEWTGDVVARGRNGYLEQRRPALKKWLDATAESLRDAHNMPAPIPREGSEVSINPEHWGVWADCVPSLFAWREATRMAELMRVFEPERAGRPIAPRYVVLPALRSLDPNLAVYRRLGVPVFRPTRDRTWVVVTVNDLRVRALGAYCLRSGLASQDHLGALNQLFSAEDCLSEIAKRLCAGCLTDEAVDAAGGWTGRHTDIVPEKRQAAEQANDCMARGGREWECWLMFAFAGVESIALGLPGSLRRKYHELTHRPALTEAALSVVDSLFARHVLPGLAAFLENPAMHVATVREGRSGFDIARRLAEARHPETLARAVQNANVRRGRDDLVKGRAMSAGCRPTPWAGWAAARQLAVLLTADEIVTELAFEVAAAGFTPIAVADDEILVELPQGTTPETFKHSLEQLRYQPPVRLHLSVKQVEAW